MSEQYQMIEEMSKKHNPVINMSSIGFKTLYIMAFLSMSFSGFSQSFTDMSEECGFNVTGFNHGVAVGDFNNDGLEDIYVSRRSATNLLYVNRGDFEFDEVAASYGLDYSGNTNVSLWFDMDNDGDMDLFIGNNFEPNILYRNDGTEFTDVTDAYGLGTTGNLRSVNAVDFDNDGDLDLYLAFVFAQNILWKNEGGMSFVNYTAEAGIDDTGRSLGAIFFDYDNDGDQDLYQTRDGDDANLFYVNKGDGRFEDKSSQFGLDYVGFGMGTDIADLNGDGLPDIYLTNLEENKLYISNAGEKFEEVSASAGVDDIGMGWSTFFFDCNNNGKQDLYLANDSYFGVQGNSNIPNQLFVNKGDLKFTTQDYVGNVQNSYGSYGAAWADFDLDGKIDIAMANQGDDGNQLFKNASITGNYISFKLKGVESNSNGIGSRVEVYAGEEKAVDYITAGSGYASQSSNTLHFGLDDVTEIDSTIIYWPSGEVQKVASPGVNQVNVVTEGRNVTATGAVVWTDPPFPNQLDDITVYYDASEGNGALEGFTGDVYAHTGLITNQSTSGSDWQHVIGNWGTADSRVLMTDEGNDIYSLSYNIQEFYGVDTGEEVLQLAFVFRNVDGSIVGRNQDGSDIYTDVFPVEDNLFMTIRSPSGDFNLIYDDDSLEVSVLINQVAQLHIYDNDELIYADSTDEAEFYLIPDTLDLHELIFVATTVDDSVSASTLYFVLEKDPVLIDPPADLKHGLNYNTDSTYIFQFYAPLMDHVFVLCPENEYLAHSEFRCHLASDRSTFWIELPVSYFENGQNSYQYLVGPSSDPFASVIVADPYSVVVLDQYHDQWIDPDILAEWPAYPEGLTGGHVTVFDVEYEAYDWASDLDKPEKTDLVVYELLMRDFLHDHSYKSLLDTLDYFEKLGVNAIELMPVNEFEGNQGWGYNPSFHMALDKYYGSRDQFKRFIDEAHSRGIAVILDVVYNHAFGQSPLVHMYWDHENSRPAANNPWLNAIPRHPFNVGYDFNHESQATKDWVKQVMGYWITEFNVDGFRLDLSKGFTQTNSLGDEALMARYDASRIAILKDYADHVWSVDSNSYVILEHFAENREEKELTNYGMMIWGNSNHDFAEAAMGYASNLDWADYTSRGWDNPHLVSYMESHDEERLMYKALKYGNSDGDYNTQELNTALRRIEAANALFYSIPGPKTFWQFGEQGYDFSINRCVNGSINNDCRLDPKPIRWNYLEVKERKRLTDRTAAMIHLKTEYPTFATEDFVFNDGNSYLKTVHLNHPDMDAVTLVNYRVTNADINPKFQYPGTWYEYFSGDSIEVENTQEKITFGPGEYRIYTSIRITPPGGFFTAVKDVRPDISINIYPNPTFNINNSRMTIEGLRDIEFIVMTDIKGGTIPIQYDQNGNDLQLKYNGDLAAGIYFVQVFTPEKKYVGKLVIAE